MFAILKAIRSPDDIDLEYYIPDDNANFMLPVEVYYGPADGEGEESFNIAICTPAWLAQEVERRGIIDGRHHLIVSRFNLPEIRSYLTAYARRFQCETWAEIASKLSRIGRWEFEDYQPYDESRTDDE